MTMFYTSSEAKTLVLTAEQIQNLPVIEWQQIFKPETPPETPEQAQARIWQLIVEASRNG